MKNLLKRFWNFLTRNDPRFEELLLEPCEGDFISGQEVEKQFEEEQPEPYHNPNITVTKKNKKDVVITVEHGSNLQTVTLKNCKASAKRIESLVPLILFCVPSEAVEILENNKVKFDILIFKDDIVEIKVKSVK